MQIQVASRGMSGLGDVESCGPDPCSWFDRVVYADDACVQYLGCVDPYDPRVIGAVGAAAHGIGTDLGIAVGSTASGLANTTNLGGYVVLVGIVGLIWFMGKR